MIREFNKQRRDDRHPSSHKPSSSRHGGERAARPARPRLNRETVDRAWESGAVPQHADYRARSSNGPSPHRDNNQRSEHPSSRNNRGGKRAYGNRQDQRPRSQSFNSDRRTPDFQNREPHNYSDRLNGAGARPRFRNDAPSRGRSSQVSARDQHRDSRQYDGDYHGHSPRQTDRSPRRLPHAEQAERFSDDRHPPSAQRRQSHPSSRRDDTSRSRYHEQFEGDYEHLGDDDSYRRKHAKGHPSPGKREHDETPEPHVTRLPDGRVLKGSRSAQRKNARFWTQVAEDTNELLDHVHLPSTEEGTGNTQEGTAAKSTPKKRQRATHSASHGRKAATRSKPRVTGSRSSRRRFK